MTTTLTPHGEWLMQEFLQRRQQLETLSQQATRLLTNAIREQHMEISTIEHRVKTAASLAGKLERKGDKYHSLDDITDLVGIRIITYYTDDVDKVAAIVKQLFKVDWSNSVDKRKAHELNSFGYNSLHYICQLKEGSAPFEIQMRTCLQHVWSAIEHDIGYKGAVKLPPEYRRQFSRLAGMLELADDEFSRLRTTMSEYRRQVQALVKSGKLDEVPLSTDSFRSYLELRPFDRLNQRIAAVNQTELYPNPLMVFMPVLELFQMNHLGDVQRMIDEDSEDAYQLALSWLAVSDIDILAESVGLQYLCLVHMLKQGGGIAGVRRICDILNGKHESNATLTAAIMEQAQNLPFMQKSR